MGATFMKLGRAPTTLITLSIQQRKAQFTCFLNEKDFSFVSFRVI
jgi:hypothetical protein